MFVYQLVKNIEETKKTPHGARLLKSTIIEMDLSAERIVSDEIAKIIIRRLIARDRKSQYAASEGPHDPVMEAIFLLNFFRLSA